MNLKLGMRANISSSKLTTLPKFKDGYLDFYKIEQIATNNFYEDKLVSLNSKIAYEKKSISDKRKYEFEERNLEIKKRICIPMIENVDSFKIAKIEGKFYEVYNSFEYVDKDGFSKIDLTLITYRGELPSEYIQE